jgi:hypothetical protein
MAPKRIDAADTVDNVTHLLHRLQSDSWGILSASVEFEYGTPEGDGKPQHGKTRLPVHATVTVELIPAKG